MKSESDPNIVSGNSAGNDDNITSEYKKMLGKESGTDTKMSLQDNELEKASIDSKIKDDSKEIHKNTENEFLVGSATKTTKGDLKEHLGVLKEALTTSKAQKEEMMGKIKKKNSWKGIAIPSVLIGSLIGLITLISESQLDPKTESPNPSSSGANQAGNNPLELVLVTPPTSSSRGNASGSNPLELVLITPGSGGGQSGNNPLELVLITPAAPVCSINFTKPGKISEIPTFGPALFEWTNVPIANEYFLKVSPPSEAGPPWTFQVNGNSKKIYMENFPMGGAFTVSVIAFSNDGKILCGTTLYFDKEELAAEDRDQGESNPPPSTPCIDTGIGYFCR